MSSSRTTAPTISTSSSIDPPPVISPSAAKRPRTMITPPTVTVVPPTIPLTAVEAHLFDLLKLAVAKEAKGTVLRVAGGWVRDKLLGKESDDVDVALDNMSGASFAKSLNTFLQQQGFETRSIGVILANPDQSKHLETARVLVLGHWIDFTNLRTETYRADSRIPDMAFGSAHDDAHRRDFTINALFYNLQTGQVEDLTGKGLSDLLSPEGVIRTPLPALTTFLDDPLRLLRAVRFAARFALPLDDDIVKAAKDGDLQKALYEKVSRERVGIEVEGMLSGKDARPALAFEMLVSLGLTDVMFRLPEEMKVQLRPERGRDGWAEEGLGTVRMVNLLLMYREDDGLLKGDDKKEDEFATTMTKVLQGLRESEAYKRPRREHRLLFLSAMLRAWAGHYTVEEKKIVKKGRESEREKRVPIVQWFIREALKLRAKDAEDMTLLLGTLDRLQALSRSMATTTTTAAAAAAAAAATMAVQEADNPGIGGGGVKGGENSNEQRVRLEAGMVLRELKELWRTGLDLACARELAITFEEKLEISAAVTTLKAVTTSFLEVLTRYRRTREALEIMGLDQIWKLRPLLDGKAVITLLRLQKGPMVGQVMEAQIEWQLQHPKEGVEALTEHLKGLMAAGTFSAAEGEREG
ncbi:hypothetical protein VYU27_001028 [Nannochloropsis oceanica]